MVFVRHLFIAGAAIPEIMRLNDAGILEEFHGPVDGGQRDRRVHGICAAVQFFGVRVVFRRGQNPRNDAPGLGHPEAFFGTEFFESIHGNVLPSHFKEVQWIETSNAPGTSPHVTPDAG